MELFVEGGNMRSVAKWSWSTGLVKCWPVFIPIHCWLYITSSQSLDWSWNERELPLEPDLTTKFTTMNTKLFVNVFRVLKMFLTPSRSHCDGSIQTRVNSFLSAASKIVLNLDTVLSKYADPSLDVGSWWINVHSAPGTICVYFACLTLGCVPDIPTFV